MRTAIRNHAVGVFDHVGISVEDRVRSSRFYGLALDLLDFAGTPHHGPEYDEWNDLALGAASEQRPVTRRLHVGLAAPSREHVDRFWRTLTEAGHPDDGPPAPRPQYSPDYYGAFVLDPDGNSVEAMHGGAPPGGDRVIDHLWIRVRDFDAARRFYATIAPVAGFDVKPVQDRIQLHNPDGSFSVLEDGEPTRHVHIAFPAPGREAVDRFHAVAVAAGYRDNGAPGERPEYHPGYYGAFVLDPDGNNVEAVFHGR